MRKTNHWKLWCRKLGKGILFSFIIILLSAPLSAQNTLVDNTLKVAKQLRNQKRFMDAAAILGDFEKKYPGNLWVEQLYAQTLYWMKDYQQADEIYRRALQYHPDNVDLKYEYALLLFDMKNFDKARQILASYSRSVKNNPAAEAMLGKLYYWNQDYKQALAHLKQARLLNPRNKEVLKLYREVFRIISPQLEVKGFYTDDTQPMDSYGGGVDFSWFASPKFDLQVSTNFHRYDKDAIPNTILGFLVGNRFHFNKSGTRITILGGAYYGNLDQSVKWQGRFEIRQKLGKYLWTNLSAERALYDYTLASVVSPLMINQYGLSLGYHKSKGWSGLAGIRSQFFPDDNYVNAYYFWFLSKPLVFSEFGISLGYAFNYMDSKEDRFETKLPTEQIIAANNPDVIIDGVYNPYFTPLNQFSNSILANIFFNFSANAQLSAHASIGVYSRTLAPGFSIDNSNQNRPEVIKTYTKQSFIPMDIGADFHADLSDKLALNLSYSYLQTYYYNANQFRLGLKFYF